MDGGVVKAATPQVVDLSKTDATGFRRQRLCIAAQSDIRLAQRRSPPIGGEGVNELVCGIPLCQSKTGGDLSTEVVSVGAHSVEAVVLC